MNRVEVTRPFVGLCFMQVCVIADATDEEIIAVCDRKNPAGTTHGWCTVERAWPGPVNCEDHQGRIHLLVGC